MKITTHLDHISRCTTTSGTNWSKRWTYRSLIINTRRDEIHGAENEIGRMTAERIFLVKKLLEIPRLFGDIKLKHPPVISLREILKIFGDIKLQDPLVIFIRASVRFYPPPPWK